VGRVPGGPVDGGRICKGRARNPLNSSTRPREACEAGAGGDPPARRRAVRYPRIRFHVLRAGCNRPAVNRVDIPTGGPRVGNIPTRSSAVPDLNSAALPPILATMDILTLVGLLLALAAIVGGSVLKGAGVAGLASGAAFVIVIVGTFAAILVQTPLSTFKRAFRLLGWVFWPPAHDGDELIRQIIDWSNTARKVGLLGLEGQVDAQADPFARKGLQMLVDGAEPESIRATMEIEIDALDHRDKAAARVFESMGIYAPTMGLIGAVLGLMAVMQNLNDPSKLGTGIAAAFTATIYGIASANLMFLPAANKLKAAIGNQSREREMLLEGLIAIARGDNPRNIESRLKGFLH